MPKFLPLILPMCAGLWGCAPTTTLNVCDGWSKLTPNVTTAVTMIKQDRKFADQVASHNRFGVKQKCWAGEE